MKKKVHEPFFTTQQKHGISLGMYICRDIITKMGGAIEVDSKVGKRTTVTIKVKTLL